jgi:putative tricarboxylic transport membrane protein
VGISDFLNIIVRKCRRVRLAARTIRCLLGSRLRGYDDANGDRRLSLEQERMNSLHRFWRMLARKDVLAGLLFIGMAVFGLWLSRDYPIGTALRMGTGYVPRLLCWLLFGLGVVVLVQGLREAQDSRALSSADVSAWRPLVFVTASLVIFGLSIERLGLVISILLLIGVGAVAARGLRPFETLAAALVLILLSWGIFILGLGLTIPVWPEW